MSAAKKSSAILLCLSLALAFLLGVFAILSASSANASQGEVPRSATHLQPIIIISPSELHAILSPDGLLSQTLWITNTGDSPLTYTIYEMSAALGLASFTLQDASNPVIDPKAQSRVVDQGEALVIIYLREQPDLSPAYSIPDRAARAQYVYDRLLETASHSQGLYDWLIAQDTQSQRLLTGNAIAATLDASQLATIAGNRQVKQVSLNRQYMIIPKNPSPPLRPQLPTVLPTNLETVEWNIAKIRADETWSTFGVRGEGAVVGIVDTGVMYDHPALVNSYRGNLGGGNFDHNYSWYDFVNGQPAPYDDGGHGTMLAGIVSGDDGAGNQIGVAPGSGWIVVKACSGGFSCSEADLHAALQWMLAPTDLDGQNPDPTKAPHVVLNGWGGGSCDSSFQVDLSTLRAAGILPIFAPGGSGPACNSVSSPGDLPEALAAGATDQSDNIASSSSRGPSCYGEIKPDLSAPGVSIRSSLNDGGYDTWSGTSLSSAHAAGAAALVISADPNLGPDAVEELLYTTALCRENLSCLGDPCPGANNVYGHGRIDVFEAVSAALGYPPYNLPWLSENPISGTLAAGEGVAVEVTFDASGLVEGTYTGTLGIASSDPITPFISVPVTLDVHQPTPVIVIDPLSFSASLPVGGTQTDTLTISNGGDGVLTFTLYEISSTRQMLAPPVELPIPDSFPANAPTHLDPAVRTQLLFLSRARLIIYLRGQPDLAAAYTIPARTARVQYVYDRLLELSAQSDDLYNWLLSQGAEPRRLLAANAIAATLDESLLEMVLSFPLVRQVGVNRHAEILKDGPAPWNWLQPRGTLLGAVEWNIKKIRADDTWGTFGVRGQGAVVGEIDTGVMYDHAALVNSYRGNLGGVGFDHAYNWFDFIDGQAVPYDDGGHGTFGMGIAVGDDGETNQIGVAPGAKWIAVKACSMQLGCSEEDLHAALAWMLAPTDLNGENPNPALGPQVVLNMWGMPSSSCDHTFDPDLLVLRAANILPVFAPGGEGPGCATVASPAANPDALSAGATDNEDLISPFSARGPSCFDGTIKPDLVAPGVNIRSSTPDGGYQNGWSGTSFSTAHLAGAAALLFSADPNISLAELEQTLFDTAVCRDDGLYCGGEACPGANNSYGYGRIDIFEAVSATLGTSFDLPWLIAGPLAVELQPGGIISTSVIFNAADMLPGTYYGEIAIESNDPLVPFTVLPVSLTVYAACQPIADLSGDFTPPEPAMGEVVTFTASATGTLPISYTWVFEDGSTVVGQQVNYTFDDPGSHIVVLTAENACSLMEMEITVPVEAVIQRFMLPLVSR